MWQDLSDPLGMVAGVRTVHGHPVDTRKSTAPSSREALAAPPCYAPFDLPSSPIETDCRI